MQDLTRRASDRSPVAGDRSASGEVPTSVRVVLAHAVVAWLADRADADVLHIKGPMVDAELGTRGRAGTDADVLVRPGHVARLQSALLGAGWTTRSTFEWGSPFGHAATFHHDVWGYVDLHRTFPGISVDPDDAFEVLWRDRVGRDVAGVAAWVPSTRAQAVILVLNAARAPAVGGRPNRDVEHAWTAAPDARRREMEGLVHRLGAEVAFAAGIGELDRYRGHRDYRLWRSVSQGGTRLEEWWGRVVAARTIRGQLAVALRSTRVNVDHLATRIGRRPTRWEVVLEFVARPLRGAAEEIGRGVRALWSRIRS